MRGCGSRISVVMKHSVKLSAAVLLLALIGLQAAPSQASFGSPASVLLPTHGLGFTQTQTAKGKAVIVSGTVQALCRSCWQQVVLSTFSSETGHRSILSHARLQARLGKIAFALPVSYSAVGGHGLRVQILVAADSYPLDALPTMASQSGYDPSLLGFVNSELRFARTRPGRVVAWQDQDLDNSYLILGNPLAAFGPVASVNWDTLAVSGNSIGTSSGSESQRLPNRPFTPLFINGAANTVSLGVSWHTDLLPGESEQHSIFVSFLGVPSIPSPPSAAPADLPSSETSFFNHIEIAQCSASRPMGFLRPIQFSCSFNPIAAKTATFGLGQLPTSPG